MPNLGDTEDCWHCPEDVAWSRNPSMMDDARLRLCWLG
jgi:hypothetical protein